MSYEPGTKKVELENGGGLFPLKRKPYAVFYVELLHKTQRAVNQLARPYMTFPGDKPPTLKIVNEDQVKVEVEGARTIDVDMAAINWDEINDAIIVNQVKEWSFGPVNQDTLDGLPERIRTRLVHECDLLYGQSGPLAKGGGGN